MFGLKLHKQNEERGSDIIVIDLSSAAVEIPTHSLIERRAMRDSSVHAFPKSGACCPKSSACATDVETATKQL